ncbi:MAG: acyl-[ACP]--phospholipid O-acyltransferase [bacterium]
MEKEQVMDTKISLQSKKFKAFLGTQFFGAFNDNAFKVIICLLAVKVIEDPSAASRMISLASGLFIIPFILLSAYAGYLADHYSKKKIMVWAKALEIVVMTLGFIALTSGSLPFLLAVLFFMGAQSTLFSPSKYGILPEMFSDEDLSRANGHLQMWTFIAIILGTATSGQLLKLFSNNIGRTGLFFISIAIIGFFTSFFILTVPPAGSEKRFELNFLKDLLGTLGEVRRNKPLFLCILGVVYLWFLGALFEMNILIYATHFMHLTEAQTGYLLAILAFGMGAGGICAGRLSGEKVEFGLVPLGALGMGIFSLLLYFSYTSPFVTGIILLSLGASSGLFVIPLTAYIQQKSPKEGLGRVLALQNFLTFSGILFASIIYYAFTQLLRLQAPVIFLVLGLSSFIVISYIIKTVPDFLLRFLMWLVTHSIYKIRIVGQENVPKEGGALLVSNHVSHIDAFLIGACIQRFIRFLMYRKYYEMRLFNPACRLLKVIPIGRDDNPKQMIRSLMKAREALAEGNLVCIFAEGQVSRTGNMLSFKKGLEVICKGNTAPIIPVYLDRVWGSIFSYYKGKFFKKIPVKLPYPVTVAFGKPLPSGTDVFRIRQAVTELGTDAYHYRKDDQELLPDRFFIQARKSPLRKCMADSQGLVLTYWKAMVASLSLSKVIAKKFSHESYIGILLPPSVGASLTNIAISITGKIPVNLNYTASEEARDAAIRKCSICHVVTSRIFLEKAGLKEREDMTFIEEIKKEVRFTHKVLSLLGFWLLPRWIVRYFFRSEKGKDITSVATIIFTSGSTGDPKGVQLSHANINANIEGLYQVLHVNKQDTIMGVLPFFHSFGFTGTLWYPLTSGMSVVYHYNPVEAKEIGRLVHTHHATMMLATPTFLLSYIRRCTKEQFASLRLMVVGAEKLKDRVREAFYAKFQLMPLEGYGCTELSPVVSLNVPDFEMENMSQTGTKFGTIGHPLPGVAVKIVDPDTYEECAVGSEGLLLVKGANVMLGYLNNKEATDKVIKNGWYITGDLAEMDEDGFVTIKDRLSRFSKIGGEMVPHLKVEEEIHAILNKKDEQVCAVTSVSDEKKGEALAVLYKGDIDIDYLYDALNKSSLPKLWIPKKTAFFQVEEIPILGSGKLDLKKIKERALNIIEEACRSQCSESCMVGV